jgi:predicted RNase H-like HicB family nuclease
MPKIPIIIEQGKENYSAYVPDIPGCYSTGKTLEELRANMREAILWCLEGMQEDGEPIPKSYSLAEYLDIAEIPEVPPKSEY